jgi:hypothetical protein
MSRLLTVLVLSVAIVLGQSNSPAQEKEESKGEIEAESQKAEGKEPTSKGKGEKEITEKSVDPVVGRTKDGKPVYEGARGGFYYLTESGNRSYVDDFVGRKEVRAPKEPKDEKEPSQQGKTGEPRPENHEPDTKSEADEAVGKTQDGKTVYEGSKDGHYYVDDKGNKTYVKDFVGAKTVGTTPGGKTIYEGPRGGHFYYNDKGNKVYVKKK